MRKAPIALLLTVAALAVAFAIGQPPPPESDLYQAWEWVHLYNTAVQNNPYSEPANSQWDKAYTVVQDLYDNTNPGGTYVNAGGFATRFFTNIGSDGTVHPCHNWFDIESLTIRICPPTSMCNGQEWQFEIHQVNKASGTEHEIGPLMKYPQDNTIVDPSLMKFHIIPGDVWYTVQVPHWHEGQADEAPLFVQDTSFWVVARPIGNTEWPSTNIYVWYDGATGVDDPWFTPLPADPTHYSGRYIWDGVPQPGAGETWAWDEDLPYLGPPTTSGFHGYPLMAALVSKHSYYPAITQPPPATSIQQGEPHDVMANIYVRSGYAGRWENQDYGPVRFWITSLDGSTTYYDEYSIPNPFLFPNPPGTANPLPATFPQWDVDVPPGDYWMYCYNAFPYDWVTTTPASKTDKKLITVVARDVGVSVISEPSGSYLEGKWVTPRATVVNYGSVRANLDVRFWIPNTPYDVMRQVTNLLPGAEQEIKFTELAVAPGAYEAHCRVYYVGDQFAANDEMTNPFDILSSRTVLGTKSATNPKKNVAANAAVPKFELALVTNPVSRVARISVPDNVPVLATVYTTSGALVKTFRTNSCDVSNLANGVYLMKVTALSKTKMLRLVVEN